MQSTLSPATARGWNKGCSFAHQSDVSLLLGFHLIEHRSIAVKYLENFSNMRVCALSYQCNIFRCTIFSIYLSCSYDIVLLLLCAIKPSQEKPCTLCLFSTLSTAKVKKNVWIFSKEFFNDADDGLGYFGIVRGLEVAGIGKIKPKDREERVVLLVKGYDIL